MPRVAGQIDQAKAEAILDAAAQVLSQRGLNAPMEAIARLAGVSKQTIYNHYGDKTGLIRAMVARKVETTTAPLRAADAPGRPEEVLAGYARSLLSNICKPQTLLRGLILAAPEAPDIVREVFESGPAASKRQLAVYLEAETRAGRLAVDDPLQAAEFFAGMVAGHRQLRGLLGLDVERAAQQVDQVARAAAHRFMRAYAPA